MLPRQLRKRYNLIYKSGSANPSSMKFPRVMLSGFQNDLTMTFSSQKDADMNILEIMDFYPKQKDFDLMKMDF
jgi:hypothetical protein